MFQWAFFSQKGVSRTENKDYFSILHTEVGTWVIVFDIATSSSATTELAKYCITYIHKQLKHKNIDDAGVRKQIVQAAFKATKQKFRVGKASFLSVFYSLESEKIYGMSAGDCRIGKLNTDSIEWLSPVHTGANPLGKRFEDEMRFMEDRHILTRSFNLRRDFDPEEFELLFLPHDILVLATDGFWLELDDAEQCSFIGEKGYASVDDTSVLLIGWKGNVIQADFKNSSYVNLLVVDES